MRKESDTRAWVIAIDEIMLQVTVGYASYPVSHIL